MATENLLKETDVNTLRARLAQVRQELTQTTAAYRKALARHDSARTIPLLRSRSRLMRELLDTQCELLLAFRAGKMEPIAEEAATEPVLER